MALLDDINQRRGFNSAARGTRAAQGIDYFSNIVPGLQTIQDQLPADAGFRDVPIPSFGAAGDALGSGGGGVQTSTRDLTTDPLSATELGFARGLSNVLGVLGPAGSFMGNAIGFNLGKDAATNSNVVGNANTDASGSMASRAGYLSGFGASPAQAAQGALASSALGRAVGMSLEGIPGGYVAGNFGFQSPAGFRGLSHSGYTSATTTEADEGAANANAIDQGDADAQGGLTSAQAEAAAAANAIDQGGGGGGDVSGGYGGVDSGGYSGDGSGGFYADGGMVGPVGLSVPGYADGGPMMPNGPLLAMGFAGGGQVAGMGNPGGDASPEMINMRVNQMLRNPKFAQMVQQTLQPLMQSGELTPQEVQVMGQIAEASLQNPKLYPQLRQFVAQQGMSPLPPAYDPTTITKILAVTRVLSQAGGGMAPPGQGQATPPGQVPPTDQAQMQNPNGMANGGFLQGPGTGRSDSIGTVNESTGQPVKVANGEYVIPEHVVKAKGRDFFDAMLRRYASVPKAGE